MISPETRQALTETAEALDEALKHVHIIAAAQRRAEGKPDEPGDTAKDVLRDLHKDLPIEERMKGLKAFFEAQIDDPDLDEIRRGIETALFFIRDILATGE